MTARTREFPDEFIAALDPSGGGGHLDRVRKVHGTNITVQGNHLRVDGSGSLEALAMVEDLYKSWARDGELSYKAVKTAAKVAVTSKPLLRGPNGEIKPRTKGQADYIDTLSKNTIIVASGPAGTGKTFLAIAHAVKMFKDGKIDRIVLSRPVVESGENLGFLPGTLEEKIDPYMRPLFDSLADCLPVSEIENLVERKIIEVAPLAYMRGRTLKRSYIILDECQNTTPSTLKLLLTRIGENSRIVATGDPKQSDIRGLNGLSDFARRVEESKPVEGIAVVNLSKDDIIRHPLVGPLLKLYGE